MIDDKDLKIHRFNSGKGGQGQNKRPCNVHVVHVPTGVEATIRGRHYHKNLAMAKKEIEKRLVQFGLAQKAAAKKAARDQRIKDTPVIRVYNFKTNIVTDLRSGKRSTIKRILGKGMLDDLRDV